MHLLRPLFSVGAPANNALWMGGVSSAGMSHPPARTHIFFLEPPPGRPAAVVEVLLLEWAFPELRHGPPVLQPAAFVLAAAVAVFAPAAGAEALGVLSDCRRRQGESLHPGVTDTVRIEAGVPVVEHADLR
jgi:hypothetical protein